MVDKSFERAIRFHEFLTPTGETIKVPLLTVYLIQPGGNRVQLSLIFDTGADVTTLRHDLYPFLGLAAWDLGQPRFVNTAGGAAPVTVYEYTARLELFGKAVDCPVHLAMLPQHPLYAGLFGRAQMFEQFGFGFWESAAELYVTLSP